MRYINYYFFIIIWVGSGRFVSFYLVLSTTKLGAFLTFPEYFQLLSWLVFMMEGFISCLVQRHQNKLLVPSQLGRDWRKKHYILHYIVCQKPVMGFYSRNFWWEETIVSGKVIRAFSSSKLCIKKLHLTFSEALSYGTKSCSLCIGTTTFLSKTFSVCSSYWT